MHNYQKVDLRFNIKSNNFVTTFVSNDEYEVIKVSLDADTKVVDKVKKVNKIDVTGKEIYIFIEDYKERIESDFDSLTDEEYQILALKEFKTRTFQDTIRREFRQTHNLTANTSNLDEQQRAVIASAKSNPELAKAMSEFLTKYKVESN